MLVGAALGCVVGLAVVGRAVVGASDGAAVGATVGPHHVVRVRSSAECVSPLTCLAFLRARAAVAGSRSSQDGHPTHQAGGVPMSTTAWHEAPPAMTASPGPESVAATPRSAGPGRDAALSRRRGAASAAIRLGATRRGAGPVIFARRPIRLGATRRENGPGRTLARRSGRRDARRDASQRHAVARFGRGRSQLFRQPGARAPSHVSMSRGHHASPSPSPSSAL